MTNLYPPHYHGGYEVRCSQVAEEMRAAGHMVRVLTSDYGLPHVAQRQVGWSTEDRNGIPVDRVLNQYLWPPQPTGRPWRVRHARRELADARAFTKLVREFRPDIVNWWSMYGLSKLLLALPGRWGIQDVHWIEHWWMIEDYARDGETPRDFWSALWDGRWGPSAMRPLSRLIGREWERRVRREGIPTRDFQNRPAHVSFVSEHMRAVHSEAGLDFPSWEIIHGGVPVDRFYQSLDERPTIRNRLRILYVGQLTPDRGLHTLIEAFQHLDSDARARMSLSVVGAGQAAYEKQVRQQAAALPVRDGVAFLGKVPHHSMAKLYQAHDLLVFPSMRDEGLPLTMVEAMLAGCTVVTTGSGGAMEVARAADLPLFPKGDALALSRLLIFMEDHPTEMREIAERGQRIAIREFSLHRMMERWLATLDRLHRARRQRL